MKKSNSSDSEKKGKSRPSGKDASLAAEDASETHKLTPKMEPKPKVLNRWTNEGGKPEKDKLKEEKEASQN